MATLVRHDTLASELLHEADTVHERIVDEVAAEAVLADAPALEHGAGDCHCSEMLSPVAEEVYGSSASALEGVSIADSIVSFATQEARPLSEDEEASQLLST